MEWPAISLGRISNTIGSPGQFAQVIGLETEKKILRMVIESYKILVNKKIVQQNWEEDNITAVLCSEIIRLWRSIPQSSPVYGLIPLPQFPVFPKPLKRGRAPTIDFVILRGYVEQVYFAFECKIVDYNNQNLISEYIDNGMKRYISGYYSLKMMAGGMIGYMFNNKVALTVDAINIKIKTRPDLSEKDCLEQDLKLIRYQ
ncbi:hypothetical protein MUP77_02840, partial [Candidatus Bathyarchaeota archaeon]|nr:hypothetical protein [Candidatus Bathyarchaeota archaeon]